MSLKTMYEEAVRLSDPLLPVLEKLAHADGEADRVRHEAMLSGAMPSEFKIGFRLGCVGMVRRLQAILVQ